MNKFYVPIGRTELIVTFMTLKTELRKDNVQFLIWSDSQNLCKTLILMNQPKSFEVLKFIDISEVQKKRFFKDIESCLSRL